jgi:hypothetical protein
MRGWQSIATVSGPDEPYLSALKDVHYGAVLIMGLHRSGTILLHKLLALTECFNIVTVYHTLRYDELLANHAHGTTDEARQRLNELFASLNLRTRMTDGMELNADLSEEYCMVLHARSKRLKLTRKNFPLFDELCKKIRYISDPTRLLLLKNPFDFSNFMTIKELVPNAKFVFIHRHPVHVLNSQLMTMRKSWTEGNPYTQILSEKYARLQKNRAFVRYMRWMTNPHSKVQLARRIFTLRAIRSMHYFFRNIELLPKSDFVSVRYEDLCENPAIEIRSILDFLGVKARAEVDYKKWIKPRPLRLLPGVERVEAKLLKRFHKALLYHCYEA